MLPSIMTAPESKFYAFYVFQFSNELLFNEFYKTLEFFFFRKEHACKKKLTAKKNIDGTYTYKENKGEHSHTIDPRVQSVKVIMQKAKIAAQTTTKPSRKLYGEALNGVPDAVIAKMPNQGAFSKQMREQRKGNHPTAPKDLSELILPEVKNSVGENFIMFDSGPSKDRIVMFSTPKSLEFLSTCDVLHMDGTVASGPVLFDQIYTILGSFYFFWIDKTHSKNF